MAQGSAGGEEGKGLERARLRVLIAGGGTGGHVIPALAIARELRDVHGAEVRFVGTARGLETELVPAAGFPLDLIRVGQLKNVTLGTRARTLADLPLGVLRCVALLRAYRPHVVVGVGGYASGPMMLAAIVRGTPTLAFEPNAVPGLANRLVGRRVSAAAVNFAATCAYFRGAVVTGIPVRQEFFAIEPKITAGQRLFIFGGSQGARVLNEVLSQVAASLLERFPELTILHQTGARHMDDVVAAYANAGIQTDRLQVKPYVERMVDEIAAADVILCRSGASTVAELAAAGRSAVLVPFAAAADDHQRRNAEVMVAAGAARMILEVEFTPERAEAELSALLQDADSRQRMAEAAWRLAHPDAAQRIATMCLKLAEPGFRDESVGQHRT